MRNIEIWVHSKLPHNNIILTGFKILERKGEIKLKISWKYGGTFAENLPFNELLEVKIDDKKVAFDMLDGYQFNVAKVEKYIGSIDYYFKRSYSCIKNQELLESVQKKIFPLSLNWNVSYFTNPIDWRNESRFRLLKTKLLYRNDIQYYESTKYREKNTILFMCRLWNPYAPEIVNNDLLQTERMQINNTRIEIIRCLKKHYGNLFVGGVEDGPVARELCPDLILPQKLTNRRRYINLMKQSKICIASTGLHGSIGWKFAEYIVAGKAVVSEPLKYEIIGKFIDGTNYYAFHNASECIQMVERLLYNPKICDAMKQANKDYYSDYAHPLKQIEYVLSVVE